MLSNTWHRRGTGLKSHEASAIYLVSLPCCLASGCSFMPSFPWLHMVVVRLSSKFITESICLLRGQDFYTFVMPEIGLSELYLMACSNGDCAKLPFFFFFPRKFFLMSFLTFSCCNLSSLFFLLSAVDMDSSFPPSCHWLFMCWKIIPVALPSHLFCRQNSPHLLT